MEVMWLTLLHFKRALLQIFLLLFQVFYRRCRVA